MNATNIQPYSRAVVKLLKGIVEKDDVVWNDVLDYQSEILDYISVMGLEPVSYTHLTLPTNREEEISVVAE